MPNKMSIKHENIAGSEFEDLNLAGAQFTNINLSGSRFHDINFSDVHFAAAQIGGTTFKHIGPPPNKDGKQERQRAVTFQEGMLCDSVFHRMDLTNVKIADCDVTGMTIDGILVTDLFEEAREKIEILKVLDGGRDAFLGALADIPEELAKTSPGPGRWSVLECAEHVAIGEDFLFSRIAQATDSDVPAVNQAREAGILARGADRTRKGVSPEASRPTGRFSTLADAVRHFTASRERTVRFVWSCRKDLRARLTMHPLLPGDVNCYEILLLMAVHPRRHAGQIQEIRTALGLG